VSETFALRGYISVTQGPVATPTGDFGLTALLESTLTLSKKHAATVSLDADAVEVISLGDIATADVLVITNVTGGQIVVRITTAAGATQIVPVTDTLLLISTTSPITAIDMQRVAGVVTTCNILVGEV